MNEASGLGPEFAIAPPGGADDASAGTLLRQAREAAGLHVASLAVALKVPVRKLEALEADRFDELPDAVFARALAASVCRTLKIDPAPVLQRLPATGAPRLALSEGSINAPFRSPRDSTGPTWKDQMSRPVFLVVAGLLFGALVLILLPSQRESVQTVQPDPAPAPAEVPFQPAPAEPVVAAPAPAAIPAPPAPVAVSAPVRPVLVQPAAATPVTAAPAAVDGVVVFKAKAQSWIQVTDAKGVVVVRRLLAAGESAAASGALPLAVTVGSANATDVVVRGKPFDLGPLARDNVARFEVK